MKIHQSGNQILVTGLNPMSDARKGDPIIVCYMGRMIPVEWLREDIYVDSRGWSIDASKLDGWIPMPVFDPSAKSPESRYEKMRKLNPAQFAELHERNLRGENFDEMVDAL